MNYYILPIVINDRREITLPLIAGGSSENATYIVEVPENVHFNVFSLLKDAEIKSLVPDSTDLSIGRLAPVYSLEGDHLKVVFNVRTNTTTTHQVTSTSEEKEQTPALTYDDLDAYVPKKKESKTPPPPTVVSTTNSIGKYQNVLNLFANNFDNGAFSIMGDVTQNYSVLNATQFPNMRVSIELNINEQVYLGSFTISFAHPEQFIGIALDFGSESSQLAIRRYQSGVQYQAKKPEHENLFKNIYSFHKSKEWIPKDDRSQYYQEEENTNFYKSIFFLKEDLSGDYEDIEKEMFIQKMNENLKMLVSSSSTDQGYATLTKERFHQLPNLKITHKYVDAFSGLNFNITKEGYEVNVSLSEIKNKTYNSILKVIVESFLKKEFIKYNGSKRKVRFILLVPNIYDYSDIRNTQLLLNKIFADFATHDYKDRILAWEVLTISESDASFLGYINKNDVQVFKDSDYIIIDAGKGTTDFSIIRTGKENVFNIKPIYRNGFAGAGNMITFAIFETLIHYIRANAQNQNAAFKFIKEQIFHNLTDDNLENKNLFYRELERLKFNFVVTTNMSMSQWANAKSGDITFKNITESGSDILTLVDLLKQIENIGDFYGYIRETCNLIAERAVSNIKLVKDNAEQFKCQGVILTGRGFMFRMLEQEVRDTVAKKLGIDNKIIHTLHGNELKDVCIKGVFNNTVRLNSEKIGYPIQIILPDLSPEAEDAKKEGSIEKKKISLSNRLLQIFFNELNDIDNVKAVIATDEHLSYSTLSRSQIMIGSKRFKVGSSSLFDNASVHIDADIVFTPQGYLVRKLEHNVVKNILPLAEVFDENRSEMTMVVPSLFPNYIDEQHIYSLKREDINKQPIMPPSPLGTIINNTPKPKGPQYF
jgi:hypothetical protein